MFDVAALRRSECTKREQQQRCTDREHQSADGDDSDHRVLEVGLHCARTVTMRERPRNFPAHVEAAIFDFDETMIDLERQHAAASARLCAANGSRYTDFPEDVRTQSGRRILDEIADMREFFRWPRSVADLLTERQRYFEEEIAKADHLALMRGVEPAVRALHAEGLRLAIASSAVRNAIEIILRRLELLALFDVIVDGSEVTRGKPDPQAYVITAGRLGVEPSRCVVFEDSEVGVRAAKSAGMYCAAVRNVNAHKRQDLSPADIIVTSFDDIDVAWFSTSARN